MKYVKTSVGSRAGVRSHRAQPEEAHWLPTKSEAYFRSGESAITHDLGHFKFYNPADKIDSPKRARTKVRSHRA
jgi:hypothetical protein